MADNWVPTHKAIGEREAYLGFALILWAGILTGFIPEIVTEGFHYPLIVHLHAMAFGGWLILLTTQCLLIRSNRRDLHRKLGIAATVLAVAMLVIGSQTALTMDRIHFAEDGKPPIFASVQFADLIAFAILIPAGFVFRKRAQLHKTLMMLAFLLYHAASRRTLNPALVLGCVLILALHVVAIQLYFWEGWIEISRRIVGV